MHRVCTRIIGGILFAILASPTSAQDAVKPLTGDEIRSQVLGHRFTGDAVKDGLPVVVRTYFSAGGKLLTQLEIKDAPWVIVMEAFEVKEDRLCFHDLGLSRPLRPDRCHGVYGRTAEGRWSGYLADSQDADARIPLDSDFGIDTNEIEKRVGNWESIRKEAGPIDAFVGLREISVNPFLYAGKVLVIKGGFHQMVGDGRAWFKGIGMHSTYDDNFIVDGIPNDLFYKQEQKAILIVETGGTFRMTREGNDEFLPLFTAKAARLCETDTCGDYFKGWN